MQFQHRFRVAITVFGLFLTLAATAAAFDDEKADKKKQDASGPSIVLKDATIHSMGTDGTFVGSIVVTDGKICCHWRKS